MLEFGKWKHEKIDFKASLRYILSFKPAWTVGKTLSLKRFISYPGIKSVKVMYLLTKLLPFLPLSFTKY